MAHQLSSGMRTCVEHCQACESVCLETMSHCLELGGPHAEARHMKGLAACAEICGTSARFILLGSEHHVRTCGVCAEVCVACAEDCDRFDDELMKRCAEICRRCAESCREMAGSHAHI